MNMPPVQKKVFVSSPAYEAMMVSAAEVYPRETDGVLVGICDDEGNYRLSNAHPYQTSRRGLTAVWPGNQCALKRVNNILIAMNGKSTRPHLIGGYHSHPYQRELVLVKPSKGDLEAIRSDCLPLTPSLDSWVEIIIKVKDNLFEKPSDKGIKHFRKLSKIATTARYDHFNGFTFISGAFLVNANPDEGYRELRLELV